jgi:hypothetical protein
MFAWRIMFQINARESLLGWRKDFVLIFDVMLARLKEHAVKLLATDFLDRYFMNIPRPGETSPTASVSCWKPWFHRNIDFMTNMREGIKVAAVDMPGKDT